jgi:hypothetical protein
MRSGGFLVMHNDLKPTDAAEGKLQQVGGLNGDAATHQCPDGNVAAPTSCSCSVNHCTNCTATCAALTNNGATEVMHKHPQEVAPGGQVSFQFQYVAPTVASNDCGGFVFGLWVNDENDDLDCFANTLDHPNYLSFRIVVSCDDGNVCTNDSCGSTTVPSTCSHTTAAAATVCRASTDGNLCDPAETCGGSQTCPADTATRNNVACTDDLNPCTVDQCLANACTHSTAASSATVCRASTDGNVCDPAETCGGALICPANTATRDGVACTTDNNVCTVDQCLSNACTHTTAAPGATVCRASADGNLCDPAETCGGALTCPADNPTRNGQTCTDDLNPCTVDQCLSNACNHGAAAPSATVCRASTDGNLCDPAETCGGALTCPANSATRDGQSCTDDSNPCTVDQCLANACTHSTAAPAATVCRASTDGDLCDPAETCGGATTCPADTATRNGQGCTDDSNPCTVDQCVSNACNHATAAPSATVCRASTDGNLCDPAETCGGATTCPANTATRNGLACTDDLNPCTVDQCLANACNHASASPAATVCRAQNGPCDLQETCGGSTVCPADAVAGVGVQCAGPTCDNGPPPQSTLASHCDSVNKTCPAGSVVSCNGALCSGNSCGSCGTNDALCTPGDFCLAGTCTPKLGAGQTCGGNNYCQTGLTCVDTVCCTSACGGGDPTDCQACNVSGSLGSCVVPVGTTCRGAAGPCDQAETCQLGNTACPADAKLTSQCRGSTGACDPAESCDGVNDTCPADTATLNGSACTSDGNPCTVDQCLSNACNHASAAPAATVCRASTDGNLCDPAETCGGATTCPADTPTLNGTACTNDGNPCTVDQCLSNACTHSTAAPGATVCRASTDGNLCDIAETCGGATTCPADDTSRNGTACTSDGNPCTVDQCSNSACNHSTAAPAATVCRASTDGNLCDIAETCGGATTCPADDTSRNGTACTSDGNPCTVDQCANSACSHATPAPAATVCRAQVGACDLPETCGGSTVCPADAVASISVQCAGPTCSNGPPSQATLASFCDSVNKTCPAGTIVSCSGALCNGTSCGGGCGTDDSLCTAGDFCLAGTCTPKLTAGLGCGGNNYCQTGLTCVDGVCCTSACGGGVATDCQACNVAGSLGACVVPVGVTCRGTAGPCDQAETCQAGNTACPADVKLTSQCRASTGACDPAESCDGVADTCPADAPTLNGTACTTDNNPCTVDQCQSNACNHAAAAPAATVCRASTDGSLCDPAETCGGATTCPADAPTLNGTACTSDGNPCTLDECQSNACNHAAAAPAATVCRASTDGNLCDIAETCGGATTCPADNTSRNGTACTDDSNPCTVDQCLNSACNHATAAPAATVCRASADGNVCDPAETCGGATTCPANAATRNGQACPDDGNPCTSDLCTANACGHATPAPAATVCRAGVGPCDVAETCGGSTVCPADAVAGTSTQCAAASCSNGPPSQATLTSFCDSVNKTCPAGTVVSCNGVLCSGSSCGGGCGTSDALCVAADFCLGGTCTPKRNPGELCSANNYCQTGLTCVDGVCCTSACGGGVNTDCQACNVPGSEGTCSVPVGTTCRAAAGPCDQADTCQAGNTACPTDAKSTAQCRASTNACDPAESCDGVSNVCPADAPTLNGQACTDDNNACTLDQCQANACAHATAPAATVCRPSTDANLCDPAEICGGAATCPPDAPNRDGHACTDDGNVCTVDVCTSNTCTHGPAPSATLCRPSTDGSLCDLPETCGGDVNCPPDAPQRDGQACTDDSNPCSVDVCTGNACTHTTPASPSTVCRASAGLCDIVENCDGSTTACPPDATNPPGTSCRAAADICDAVEVCDGSAQCPTDVFKPATTICVDAKCAAGTETLTTNCSGNNASCQVPLTQQCTPYVCQNTACGTTCTSKTDCDVGFYCDPNHKCTPTQPPGSTCTDPNSCGSGFCVDGVCCDGQCNGQCEACDLPNALGNCLPTTAGGAPHGARTPCDGDGSRCQGICDGTNRTQCSLPGPTQVCRDPVCQNGTATVKAVCRGDGTCPALEQVDCAPKACAAATGDSAQCVGDCTVDEQCQAGHFCKPGAGTCTTKLDPGTQCGGDNQCASHHCVDGVCCDTACTGQCEACDATPGTCTAVLGRPHKGRADCASDSQHPECAGQCDGTHALSCVYPGAGVDCRTASCTNDIAVPGASCTGTGTCPLASQQACAPNTCSADGTVCGDGCVTDADCAGLTQFCSAGVCLPKHKNGTQCGTSNECVGACVDGYCCNTACNEQCAACNILGKEGTCTAVTGSPRGLRAACNDNGTGCGGVCDGVNQDACAYPGSTTTCTQPTCDATTGIATLAQTCDGSGACPPSQHQLCGQFVCGATACNGDCSNGPCADTTNYCSAGVCVPKLPQGGACATNAQCSNGQCVDGYCCDVACAGQCQACDVTGSEGTCTTIKNDSPHGGRAACPGAGSCASLCDGTSGTTCIYPGSLTTCGSASCTDGTEVSAPACNGAGVCLPSDSKSCAPYVCGPSACVTSCTDATQCAAGFECDSGECKQPVDAGVDSGAGNPDASTSDGSAGSSGSGDSGSVADGGGTGGSSATDASAPDGSVEAGIAGTVGAPGAVVVNSKDSGGCGCRVPAKPAHDSAPILLALAVIGLAGRRGRRRRVA